MNKTKIVTLLIANIVVMNIINFSLYMTPKKRILNKK